MDKEKLLQRLMATFLGELEEHSRALNRDLLALEKEPPAETRTEVLKTLFRTAHSLKGAARSVNVGPVEAACHRLEGIIADVRDGALPLRPELFQLLFATVDAIEDAGKRLRDQRGLSDSAILALLPRLENARRSPSRDERGAEPDAPLRAPREEKPAAEVKAEVNTSLFVRIQAAKLDALLAASGELLVARRRLEPRVDELGSLAHFVGRWKEDWRKSVAPLRAALGSQGTHNGSARAVSPKLTRALEQVTENLDRAAGSLDMLLSSLVADRRALERAASPLEGEVRRARMVPFAEACEGLERVVRDIAKSSGKEAALAVEGGDIELDRSVLAELKDPLLHLVRNAVDHGLETPSKRVAAGKPARGVVKVGAALHGERVRITVTDDGAGLDVRGIQEAAARRKLPLPVEPNDVAQLILLPGFSTAHFITEVSGRGVGLDVVKSKVEALHGAVAIRAAPGRGLSVMLDVPLTLTTIRAVLLSVAGQTLAIPQTHVERLERIGADDIRSFEGREVVTLGAAPIPLVSMAEVLGAATPESARKGAKIPVVLLAAGGRRAAFSVDELLAEQDLIVTNLGPRLRRLIHYAGATLLPNGRIALILNAGDLLHTALGREQSTPVAAQLSAAVVEPKQLIVVDDSVTTRSLVKSILESAGYAVTTAPDGAAAWQLLQERGADLVVSDVEMPRMDGCALAATIRNSTRFRKLPVILVTALDSAEDRARGLESGADAYLIKSAFDQRQLLEAIAQLV